MPARSKAQQQAAGAALSAKRGEKPASELFGASRQMYDSMSEEQLDELASTKQEGRPAHVGEPAAPAMPTPRAKKAAKKMAIAKRAKGLTKKSAKKAAKKTPMKKMPAKKAARKKAAKKAAKKRR
jgi:hypothetical protein